MRVYLAGVEGSSDIIKKIKPKNLLMSYYSLHNKSLEKIVNYLGYNVNIFLDSGAFTAYTQKKVIDIHKYIRYIKKYKKYIHLYANLDVIGDADKTKINQKIMENEQLKPLPTYHFGEPEEYLDYYLNNYNYIALGALVNDKRNKKRKTNLIKKSVLKAKKRNVKIHLFGITDAAIIKKYYDFIYSVDSTSWLSGSRFGNCYFFERGSLKNKKLNNFNVLKHDKIDLWNLIQWKKFSDYMGEK